MRAIINKHALRDCAVSVAAAVAVVLLWRTCMTRCSIPAVRFDVPVMTQPDAASADDPLRLLRLHDLGDLIQDEVEYRAARGHPPEELALGGWAQVRQLKPGQATFVKSIDERAGDELVEYLQRSMGNGLVYRWQDRIAVRANVEGHRRIDEELLLLRRSLTGGE